MDQHDEWVLLCTLLSIMYGTLCILCGIQLFRILYYRHNLKSFHFAFLLLCFCWTLLRVIFFAETEYLEFYTVLVLFWTPLDFQFATFSLLVVFYVYLLYKREWQNRKKAVFLIYGVSVFSMFAMTTVYIIVGDRMGVTNIKSLEVAHHLYMAVQLTILTMLYAYYGYQLSVVNSVPYFEVSTGDGGGGRPMIWITLLGFLIFLSRAVYVFLAAFDIGLIELGGNNGGLKTPTWTALFSFLWWEILPTLTVLIYFRKIPKTRVRSCPFPFLPCCAPGAESMPNSATSPPPLPGVGSDIGGDVTDPYHEPFAQYDDPENLDPALLQTGPPAGSDGLFDQQNVGANRYDTDGDDSNRGLSPPPTNGGGTNNAAAAAAAAAGRGIVNVDGVISK